MTDTQLEGREIRLRHIRGDDMDAVIELTRKFPDIGGRFPYSLLTGLIEKKFFEPGEAGGDDPEACLLIVDKAGAILGCIAYFQGLRYVEGYELAYHIFRPSDRGKGYMSEAMKIILPYLFQVKKAPRIQVNVEKGKESGIRVVQKHGFKHEGTMRRAVLADGQYNDLELFSLLVNEWNAR